jgi:hypothetical protein
MDIFFSSCTLPEDFWAVRSLSVALPVIIAVAVLMISFGAHELIKRKNPKALQDKRIPDPFERGIYFYSAGLLAMYTFLLSIALSPFRCFEQVDGSWTLVPAPYLNCFDDNWNKHGVSTFFGLLYIILIPLFFAYLLYIYPSNEYNNAFHFRFGFLVKGFRRKFYWWGLFLLFRKTVLVMTIDLSSSYNLHLRAFFALIVLVSCSFIEAAIQPRIESSASRILSIL